MLLVVLDEVENSGSMLTVAGGICMAFMVVPTGAKVYLVSPPQADIDIILPKRISGLPMILLIKE